jgi:hypothetical protein
MTEIEELREENAKLRSHIAYLMRWDIIESRQKPVCAEYPEPEKPEKLHDVFDPKNWGL